MKLQQHYHYQSLTLEWGRLHESRFISGVVYMDPLLPFSSIECYTPAEYHIKNALHSSHIRPPPTSSNIVSQLSTALVC